MFSIKAVELGKLKKLKIRHDNYGGGAAWFLDHIEVEDPKHRHTYVDLDIQDFCCLLLTFANSLDPDQD